MNKPDQIVHQIIVYQMPRLSRTIKMANEIIRTTLPKRILDIGCNDGFFLSNIKDKHISLYGVDIDDNLLRTAESKGIKTKHMDAEIKNFPYKHGFFDMVFALEIIEHLRNPDLFLTNVNKVLREGGILFLSTPNLASWRNRLLVSFGYMPTTLDISMEKNIVDVPFIKKNALSQHVRNYTLKAMLLLLYLYGFEQINIVGTYIKPGGKLLYLIDRFFSNFPTLSSYFLIIAKKHHSV